MFNPAGNYMKSDERAVPHRAVLGDLHSLRESYYLSDDGKW
jgi:hypothetical protein